MTPPASQLGRQSMQVSQLGQLGSKGMPSSQTSLRNIQPHPGSALGSRGGQAPFVAAQPGQPAGGTQPIPGAHSSGTGTQLGPGKVQLETNAANKKTESGPNVPSTLKPKQPTYQYSQKSKIGIETQQSLHSLKGFIRQLEDIHNRTPKQEAMLQQLLDLQQKINTQAKAKLGNEGSGAPPTTSGAGGAATQAGNPAPLPQGTRAAGVQNVSGIMTASTNLASGQASNLSRSLPAASTAASVVAASAAAAAMAVAASAQLGSNSSAPSIPPAMPQPGVKTEPEPSPSSSSSVVRADALDLGAQVASSVGAMSANSFQQIFTTNIVQLVGKNLTPQQQDVLKKLQDQLKNMTPQQQQEFYRQQQSKLQQLQATKKIPDVTGAPIQPTEQPSSSTPIPKPQLSPVRAPKPSRSKAKKKGSKGSPKGDRGEDKGGKDVDVITPPPPLPVPPKAPTPPPAAAEFLRERRDLDKYCVDNIQFKAPFASYDEAIQRLLPHHMAHEKIPSQEKWDETAVPFEEISGNLLEKKSKMLDKFRLLLYKESMRKEPSSEMVMVQRMFLQDERALMQHERKLADTNRGESLMPKIESSQESGTIEVQTAPVGVSAEHSFAQPARVGTPKAEPRHKTNHDRIRSKATESPSPHKRVAGQEAMNPPLQRQRATFGESDTRPSSAASQYHSSIVSKYGSSDEEESAASKGASSSGGGIRLRLTKSLLVESNVKSKDRYPTSESDDSVLSSPTKPKRRKSRLEALLSSDSVDSDLVSPSLDYRTKGGGGVWTVSQRSRDSVSSFQDRDGSSRDSDVSQGLDASRGAIMVDDSDEEDQDCLQEQMDSAVNSILFLQNPGGTTNVDPSRHASLADISFDHDDVFDSIDESGAFNVEDYANASFLEEHTAVAGLESDLTSMESDVEEAVRSIL